MASKSLRLVRASKQEAQDITRLLRAEIEKRDWSRVMIEGDKAKPLMLVDRVRRPWRG